jgi:acyl-coenzyme A thioesterase PaaI-like protein
MTEEENPSRLGTRVNARSNSSCFVCGPDNPRGLRLHFEQSERGEMSATWVPDLAMEGFEGIVHGGIVSTVLDESMAKAVTASGSEAVMAELRVRFRRHVVAERPIHVRGWVTDKKKRMIHAEAAATDSDGKEFAHGWATFLTVT